MLGAVLTKLFDLPVETVGSKFGSDLLKHGFRGKYNNIGTHKEGSGGLWQQMGFQGLDSEGIFKSVKALA